MAPVWRKKNKPKQQQQQLRKEAGSLWIHAAVPRPFCFRQGFSLCGSLAATSSYYSVLFPEIPGRDGQCQAEGWHVLAHPDSLSQTLEWQAGGCQRPEEKGGLTMPGRGGGAGLVHRVLASEAKARARPKQMVEQKPQTRTCGRTRKRWAPETRRLYQIGSRCYQKPCACFSVRMRTSNPCLCFTVKLPFRSNIRSGRWKLCFFHGQKGFW